MFTTDDNRAAKLKEANILNAAIFERIELMKELLCLSNHELKISSKVSEDTKIKILQSETLYNQTKILMEKLNNAVDSIKNEGEEWKNG